MTARVAESGPREYQCRTITSHKPKAIRLWLAPIPHLNGWDAVKAAYFTTVECADFLWEILTRTIVQLCFKAQFYST